jgi:hypothetical protein
VVDREPRTSPPEVHRAIPDDSYPAPQREPRVAPDLLEPRLTPREGRPLVAGSTAREATQIEVPLLPLRHSTVDEHAQALVAARSIPFWWYQGTSRLLGNYSLPFRGSDGTWWYQVKPGLCWPVDFLRSRPATQPGPPISRSYMGYQHIIDDDRHANSRLVINVIGDLRGYGAASVGRTRRKAIRRGLRECDVGIVTAYERDTFEECRQAWNDLSQRTGWRRPVPTAAFETSWRALLDLPGVSIMVARHRVSGRVAGFRITKIIGDTAYGDTTASSTAMLDTNVNSAMMYAFLAAAATLPGVTKAHLALKSRLVSLEDYKTSFGFEAHRFAAVTRLRPGVAPALRLVSPANYDRMTGNV